MPPRPPLPLSARLSDLVPWWLELQCCRGTTLYPLQLLARGRRDDPELHVVLPLLRCRRCGGRPTSVALVEDAASDGPNGQRRGWRIELIKD